MKNKMKYKTQIRAFIKYYILKMQGIHETPRPSLWYPTDGWIYDPVQIKGLMAQDGFDFRPEEEKESH
jgi:hypothetical protein